MFLKGYIEKAGTGTEDIITKCVNYGLDKPAFHQDSDFKVTIWRKQVDQKTSEVSQKADEMTQKTSEVGQKTDEVIEKIPQVTQIRSEVDHKSKRVRDAAFFLIIMLVTFAATLLKPQKYVSSRTIQKCVEHVSTST